MLSLKKIAYKQIIMDDMPLTPMNKVKLCPISKTQCPGKCVYANIFETIDLGIVVLDIKNKSVILQNDIVKKIFDSSPQGIEYRHFIDLFLPGSHEKLTPNWFGTSQTIRFGDKLLGYTPYTISDEYMWILIRDITEKARLESIAEEVNMMDNIQYIFSTLRHELGNPTNSIKMTLSVLKNSLKTFSPDTVNEYIDRSLTEISRLEYLLKSLKSFSMFETLHIENINLPGFMNRFISLVENEIKKSGITIKASFHPAAEWVKADYRALQQILLNLITNASDALNNTINPEIFISTRALRKWVQIEIRDTGCGISEESKANLFKPFYTTKPSGTGLGLTITRKALAKMNGSLQIESQEGAGTTAAVFLPESHENDI